MTSFSTWWPAVGATAALVMFLLGYRMMRGKPSEYLDAADLVLLKEERRREASGRLTALERLAGRFVPALRRRIGPTAVRYLQRQIDHAGRPVGVTVDGLLRRICWWLLILVPVLVLFVVRGVWLAIPLLPVCAVLLPLARITGTARRRRESIDRDLPDFLDILAVTVTAGITFRAAMVRVTDRFGGPLQEEVRLTLDQLAHGASVRVAFTNFDTRSGSSAVHSFVSAFLQAEELGAPLAETLNQIALDMRRDNAQRVRRKAQQTAPRVTLATSFIFVPATLVLMFVGFYVASGLDLGAMLKSFG
ncbi:type II secretion system F family protein [Microlunatus flavus]|uniref:Tight adherence protein C n=1 Tax=Microlunatus flavus TaxID=1036181 RepID=A0A1H9A226_9ACTN|nr:type II secretion system F family protein [Microlunatus flavus]SEP70563.1 tight adherence protein C [Microlunatus flavus]